MPSSPDEALYILDPLLANLCKRTPSFILVSSCNGWVYRCTCEAPLLNDLLDGTHNGSHDPGQAVQEMRWCTLGSLSTHVLRCRSQLASQTSCQDD
jgi:hypothetical protein